MARLIFITGGVVSSLGKGLASAALGALLQARGYKVRLRKLDPYLNVDPGTMSPFQHGEVYVTDFWQVSETLKLEASLSAEFSRISQSGDAAQEREACPRRATIARPRGSASKPRTC